MIENTLEKFLAELHKAIEEEPTSYTAAIMKGALPNQALYPEQAEHIFHEFANLFRADTELLGNNEIIEYVIENFPYAHALSNDQATREFNIKRFINNFRQNYLEPKLYLVSEELKESLESQGLEALSAAQIQNPVTGEISTEVIAQNQEGLIYQARYDREGTLLNLTERPNYDQASPQQTRTDSTSLESIRTVETNYSQTLEQQTEFDDHVATQAEALQDDQLDLLYVSNLKQAELEQETATEEQLKLEQESIERNKREYEQAEASRLERLAYDQKQQENAKRQQTQSKTGRRIAIAAGTGAAMFSGGLASIIIGGDLIGLFS